MNGIVKNEHCSAWIPAITVAVLAALQWPLLEAFRHVHAVKQGTHNAELAAVVLAPLGEALLALELSRIAVGVIGLVLGIWAMNMGPSRVGVIGVVLGSIGALIAVLVRE